MKKAAIFIGVFIALMAVFTFTDLAVSQALFNIDSVFGRICDVFGECVSSLVGIFAAALLIRTQPDKRRFSGVLAIALWLILLIMNALMLVTVPVSRINAHANMYIPMACGLAFAALTMFLVTRLGKDTVKEQRAFAGVSMVTVMGAVVAVNIIKSIWGRVRFREMLEPFGDFTDWFRPQLGRFSGTYLDPKSFPSGHSANAAVIIVIVLLPYIFKKLKGKEPIHGPLLWRIRLP